MRNFLQFSFYYLKSKWYPKRTEKLAEDLNTKHIKYGRNKLYNASEIHDHISKNIDSGRPFLVGRYGSTELLMMRDVEFQLNNKIPCALHQLSQWSGFFPEEVEYAEKFVAIMKETSSKCDIFGIWFNQFEEYFIKKYLPKNVTCSYLFSLEPWSNPSNPWTKHLEGKKVLVIHPFAETIQSQYSRREKIYPGTDILPEFDLITLKAVQTVAGEKDERFATWFDALEWMYQDAMKLDFDIAIIGCGAYGFPLAGKLKKAGKQAIHLAGATQLLFGIRGKRWDTNPAFEYVRKWYNDAWVYPCDADRPTQANKVENGCYW